MKTIKMYTSENVTANSGKILTSTKEITMLGKLFIQLEMKKKMNQVIENLKKQLKTFQQKTNGLLHY